MQRDIQDAAVGKFQARAGSKLGQPQRLVDVSSCYLDTGGADVVSHRRTATHPDTTDEDLRQGEGVHEHGPRCGVQQNRRRHSVMSVERAEVSDQDAGVHGDHAGQSSRSSAK